MWTDKERELLSGVVADGILIELIPTRFTESGFDHGKVTLFVEAKPNRSLNQRQLIQIRNYRLAFSLGLLLDVHAEKYEAEGVDLVKSHSFFAKSRSSVENGKWKDPLWESEDFTTFFPHLNDLDLWTKELWTGEFNNLIELHTRMTDETEASPSHIHEKLSQEKFKLLTHLGTEVGSSPRQKVAWRTKAWGLAERVAHAANQASLERRRQYRWRRMMIRTNDERIQRLSNLNDREVCYSGFREPEFVYALGYGQYIVLFEEAETNREVQVIWSIRKMAISPLSLYSDELAVELTSNCYSLQAIPGFVRAGEAWTIEDWNFVPEMALRIQEQELSQAEQNNLRKIRARIKQEKSDFETISLLAKAQLDEDIGQLDLSWRQDCSVDINGDRFLGFDELEVLIEAWGRPLEAGEEAKILDSNKNNRLDAQDLDLLLNHWGPCASPDDTGF